MEGDGSNLGEIVDVLLSEGLDPFQPRMDGVTPFVLLVSTETYFSNQTERNKVLRRLAVRLEPFEARRKRMTQALHALVELPSSQYEPWHTTVLKTLLENGADLLSKNTATMEPFKALSQRWQDACAEDRATAEADSLVSETSDELSSPATTLSEMTDVALGFAAIDGLLHELCVDPSLLSTALKRSDPDLLEKLFEKLFEHHLDVDRFSDSETDSPIKLACRHGCSSSLLERLLDRSKALVDRALGSELVREICLGGHDCSYEVLSILLEAGLDPNGQSCHGETALMFAARAGNTIMVKLLLSYGSRTDILDHDGWSPAHYAVRSGRVDVLRVLKDTEIDWNAKTKLTMGSFQWRMVTVLHMAVMFMYESDPTLKWLLLNIDLTDMVDAPLDNGDTPLYIAIHFGHARKVALLLPEIRDQPSVARTAYAAAQRGNVNVLQEFLTFGHDMTLTNEFGLDCETIAWQNGHRRAAAMLSERSKTFDMVAPDNLLIQLMATC